MFNIWKRQIWKRNRGGLYRSPDMTLADVEILSERGGEGGGGEKVNKEISSRDYILISLWNKNSYYLDF